MQTLVDFLPWKYDVISPLRHDYAKGPFVWRASNVCVLHFLAVCLGWLLILCFYKDYKCLNMFYFDYTAFSISEKIGIS